MYYIAIKANKLTFIPEIFNCPLLDKDIGIDYFRLLKRFKYKYYMYNMYYK